MKATLQCFLIIGIVLAATHGCEDNDRTVDETIRKILKKGEPTPVATNEVDKVIKRVANDVSETASLAERADKLKKRAETVVAPKKRVELLEKAVVAKKRAEVKKSDAVDNAKRLAADQPKAVTEKRIAEIKKRLTDITQKEGKADLKTKTEKVLEEVKPTPVSKKQAAEEIKQAVKRLKENKKLIQKAKELRKRAQDASQKTKEVLKKQASVIKTAAEVKKLEVVNTLKRLATGQPHDIIKKRMCAVKRSVCEEASG